METTMPASDPFGAEAQTSTRNLICGAACKSPGGDRLVFGEVACCRTCQHRTFATDAARANGCGYAVVRRGKRFTAAYWVERYAALFRKHQTLLIELERERNAGGADV